MSFRQYSLLIICLLITIGQTVAQDVLIVADEIPAMEILADAFKKQENITCKIVTQFEMPPSLTDFKAVIVYIHKDMDSLAEKAFINYAKNGGKLICLHHSISSMKRKNEQWFPFLGINLPKKEVNEGGYKYIGGVKMSVVNLAPKHFITTHKIKYDTTIVYKKEAKTKEKRVAGFVLDSTEAFVNHVLLSPRTILLGFKITDVQGKIWMQDRSAWCMRVDKGWIFYSQPGHAVSDFENPLYARIVINAVLYKF